MPGPRHSISRSRWRHAASSSRARLKLISGVHGRRSSRCPSRPGAPAEPGPRRHEREQVVRRTGQVVLARDPQRIGGSARLQAWLTRVQPDRRQTLVARYQVGDAEGEVLVERKRRQRRGERAAPAACAATRPGPARRQPRAAARPRRRARRPLALLRLSRSRSPAQTAARESCPPDPRARGEQLVSSANEAAIAGVEGLEPPLAARAADFLPCG